MENHLLHVVEMLVVEIGWEGDGGAATIVATDYFSRWRILEVRSYIGRKVGEEAWRPEITFLELCNHGGHRQNQFDLLFEESKELPHDGRTLETRIWLIHNVSAMN